MWRKNNKSSAPLLFGERTPKVVSREERPCGLGAAVESKPAQTTCWKKVQIEKGRRAYNIYRKHRKVGPDPRVLRPWESLSDTEQKNWIHYANEIISKVPLVRDKKKETLHVPVDNPVSEVVALEVSQN